ncbi:MAG: hypothetical protein OXC63_09390, partial [Aestuariivita sp.]|nr:hypothetical protein [Aestuariivita sp.]
VVQALILYWWVIFLSQFLSHDSTPIVFASGSRVNAFLSFVCGRESRVMILIRAANSSTSCDWNYLYVNTAESCFP